MQGTSIMNNSVRIFLCFFLFFVLVQGVQAAETYQFVTKWGTQGAGDGQFYQPWGVAVDSSGNVYVADMFNNRIQKFSPAGTLLNNWGTVGSGDGQFSYPSDVAVDSSGNVYIADHGNHRIQKFSSNGTFLGKWGISGSGDGQFNLPMGVAVDSSGNIYVADELNNRIQKFSSTWTLLEKWGSYGSGDGQFNHPVGVAVDSSGNVYVADTANNRIQKFSSNGTFLGKWGTSGSGDGQFSYLSGVAIDSSGNVYVVDSGNTRIQKFSPTGTFLGKWGTSGSGDGQFNLPMGVAVDSSGNVYIAEYNNRIQKFAPSTPIPPPITQKIIIGGENYVDANVQKTGATWDSAEEKCPTWRGNDWSGTGDYYLSHGGDTLTYLINSPATGNYVMWMRDWSDTNHTAGDRQVTITIDGATIGTFDAASSFNKGTTGYGWDKFTTVNLGAGSHTMKITKKDTTSSAAIIDELWFSSNVSEIPSGYTAHSETLCVSTPSPTQKIIVEGEKYVDANVKKTGATWDSAEEKCPTWRGNDWSGTGDYYLSNGGDTLTYLINSPATGNYVMWMRDWSDPNHATGDRQVTITIDGATIGTFDAASSFNKGTTGYGWDKFTTVNLGGGSHTMKITKKDTASSAAIIDELWFSSNVNEIPQGYNIHSEALCPVIAKPGTTTPQITTVPWTQESPPLPYCTPPQCPSGKYVCLQKDGCPGGCGYSCGTITPQISIPPPTPSGIETIVILIAIGLGVVFFAKRRD